MAGAALMAAGIGLQIGGQIYMTTEALKSARAARRESKRLQRQIFEDMVVETRLRREEGTRLEGIQQQRIAGAGVRVGKGSPIDILMETHLGTEFAVRRIEETAQRLAYRVNREYRAIKKNLRQQTISSVISSTAGTLMSMGMSAGSGNMFSSSGQPTTQGGGYVGSFGGTVPTLADSGFGFNA